MINIKEVVEGWLAKAENPATGMEVELNSAREKIKLLEHKLKEEVKIGEIKQQEETIQDEKYEKVTMMMAKEIRNLQEGKEPGLASGKDKALAEAREKLITSETEKEILEDKLEKANKVIEEVVESRNTLMKVVESVNNVKKVKKNKSKVTCREFDKPSGCAWGEQCRFEHVEGQGLEKKTDCSYWMAGHCRCAGICTIQPRRVTRPRNRVKAVSRFFRRARRCRKYLQGRRILPGGRVARTGNRR